MSTGAMAAGLVVDRRLDHAGTREAASTCTADDDWRLQLEPVLAFLQEEVSRSSAMLRDIAEVISTEVHALLDPNAHPRLGDCALNVAEALQNEDRVQQRLDGVCSILGLLEHLLKAPARQLGEDVHSAIVNELRLDEMRWAFATKVGIAGADHARPASHHSPSAGEVDLF